MTASRPSPSAASPPPDPRSERALESLRRHQEGLEDVFHRYGVPETVAPGLLAEALLAMGSGVGGAPLQGARLLRAAELVCARWAAERDRGAKPEATATEGEPADFAEVLRSVARRMASRHRDLEEEHRAADVRVHELLATTPEGRENLAEERRFHTWAVVDHLLSVARRLVPNRPAEARALARLAGDLASHLREHYYGKPALRDLEARVEWVCGDSHRVERRYAEAEESLARAGEFLEEGTLDPRLRAEAMILRASLRRDQGRLSEAETLLGKALAVHRWIGETHEQGRVRLAQAVIHDRRGESEAALARISEALELLEPEREPRLTLVALQLKASQVNRLGRHAEAARLLPWLRELCAADGGPLDRLRLDWLHGAVALAAGKADGEAILLSTRRRYLDLGMVVDAALVSVDLLARYLQQGRIADTRSLTDEMVATLGDLPQGGRELGREALAALYALQQAAREETPSLPLLRRAHDALSRCQGDDSAGDVPEADGGAADPS